MMRTIGMACAGALLAAPVAAGEAIGGIGIDDVFGDAFDRHDRTPTAGFALELRTDPLARIGPVSLAAGAAGETDLDGDLWGGLGPVATWSPGGGDWRLGASAMPGVYEDGGDGNDLGGTFEIRLQLYLDRAATERSRIGLALGHKSNAGLNGFNPGIETLFLTWGWSF